MDPTATLNAIRKAFDEGDNFDEAADLFEELDEWISKGGFLPTDWMQAHL